MFDVGAPFQLTKNGNVGLTALVSGPSHSLASSLRGLDRLGSPSLVPSAFDAGPLASFMGLRIWDRLVFYKALFVLISVV